MLGGDGTVSCAANGLLGTGAALAVLPAGTGDDFARAIGAGSFPTAVRLLANPKTVPIDVVRLRSAGPHRCFVNIAGRRLRLRGQRDRERDVAATSAAPARTWRPW